MMKAWIMQIDSNRTTVFFSSPIKEGFSFSTVINEKEAINSMNNLNSISDEFAHYVAEEIEIACGIGTDCGLIISGESKDVQKVCQCLSPEVKRSILGIAPKGYNPVLWKTILNLSLMASTVSG